MLLLNVFRFDIKGNSLKEIFQLLRVHQYIKNIFIFTPLLFSFSNSIYLYFQATIAFIVFSLLASGIYIFNDLNDIDEDKLHPTKSRRPVASGKISLKFARNIFLALSSTSLIFAYFINFQMFGILFFYFILNILYSIKLKHIAILDIFIISTGFVLRLFVGSVVTGVVLSKWIIIMTFLLALFLALAKRRDDVLLANRGEKTRKNIDGYNLEFINLTMVLMAGVVIVSYILYTVSNEVVAKIGSENLYLTSLFVILGIFRYMQITFVEELSGSPTKVVLKDSFMQISIVLWLVSFYLVIKFL